MAFILPDGVIQFMQYDGDKNYNHTLLFDTVEYQTAHFDGKVKRQFTAQSYSRYSKNSIRVSALSDEIIRYNYMRFRNTSFNNKWFYAFIDRVEYVSNNVCEVFFTIDVIQTWRFNFTFGKCFVEREHTASDELFEHTIKEPVGGDEAVTIYEQLAQPATSSAYVVILYVPNDVISGGRFIDSVFSGLSVKIFEAQIEGDVIEQRINEWLTTNQIKSTSIYAMYQVYAPAGSLDDRGNISTDRIDVVFRIPRSLTETLMPSFVPKNKKLYCSQFTNILVTNGNGGCRVYKPELLKWADDTTGSFKNTTFNLLRQYAPLPLYVIKPENYGGVKSSYWGDTGSFDYSVVISEFPTCSWATDSFAAWWAQNKNSYSTGMITTGVNTAFNAIQQSIMQPTMTGAVVGVAGSVVSGITSIATQLAKLGDIKNTPDQIAGSASKQNIFAQTKGINFSMQWKTQRPEILKIIDDFFTMYGYQVNELKYPNFEDVYARRPLWNYIKTNGCVIHPVENNGLPADVEQTISDIFDKGITFWEPTQQIGDYTGDNSPQGD